MRTQPPPTPWQTCLWFLGAAVSYSLHAGVELPRALDLMMVFATIVFVSGGVVYAVLLYLHERALHIRRMGLARSAELKERGDAFRGQSLEAQRALSRFTMAEVAGISDNLITVFQYTMINGQKIDLEFVMDFVDFSEDWTHANNKTMNCFYPVRDHHDNIWNDWRVYYPNIEEILRALTSDFHARGWANKATGTLPATLALESFAELRRRIISEGLMQRIVKWAY